MQLEAMEILIEEYCFHAARYYFHISLWEYLSVILQLGFYQDTFQTNKVSRTVLFNNAE